MHGPLAGIRVLEIGQWIAGPLCAAMLGDLGAEVIKVERPLGDEQRGTPPHRGGLGSIFNAVNRGKRSIVLDLARDEDRAVAVKLASHADVVVENLRPGALATFGLDYASVRTLNEAVVYCSVSGFGQSGPLAREGGFDIVAQAMSGLMSLNGPTDLPAHRLPIPIADVAASMYATIAVLAALRDRDATGVGQQVDVSLLESAMSFLLLESATYLGGGGPPPRLGQFARNAAPYQVFTASDGPLVVAAAGQALWTKLCGVLQRPDLLEDERYATPAQRLAHNGPLADELQRCFGGAPVSTWVERLRAVGIPTAPVLSVVDALEQPQFAARQTLVECSDPQGEPLRMVGPVVRLRGQATTPRTRAPLLDEDRTEILDALHTLGWPRPRSGEAAAADDPAAVSARTSVPARTEAAHAPVDDEEDR